MQISPAITFYHPEIPHNVGALMRLSAAWNVCLNLIGPFPFVWSDAHIRRCSVGCEKYALTSRYDSWEEYRALYGRKKKHWFLSANKGKIYTEHYFSVQDCFIVGSESSGFAPEVEVEEDRCVHIPMSIHVRSLNVSMAAAMVLSLAYARLQWEIV